MKSASLGKVKKAAKFYYRPEARRWTMAALYTSGVDQPRSPQVCFPGTFAA